VGKESIRTRPRPVRYGPRSERRRPELRPSQPPGWRRTTFWPDGWPWPPPAHLRTAIFGSPPSNRTPPPSPSGRTEGCTAAPARSKSGGIRPHPARTVTADSPPAGCARPAGSIRSADAEGSRRPREVEPSPGPKLPRWAATSSAAAERGQPERTRPGLGDSPPGPVRSSQQSPTRRAGREQRETGRERRDQVRQPPGWQREPLPRPRRDRGEAARKVGPNHRGGPAPTSPAVEASSGRADWSAPARGPVGCRPVLEAEWSAWSGERLSKPAAATPSLVRPETRRARAGVGPGQLERSPQPAEPAHPVWWVPAEPAAPGPVRLPGASVSRHSGRNWSPDQPQRCRTEGKPSLHTVPVVQVGAVSGLLSVEPPRISPCGYRHLTLVTRDSA
jgi:hypothetical protein